MVVFIIKNVIKISSSSILQVNKQYVKFQIKSVIPDLTTRGLTIPEFGPLS